MEAIDVLFGARWNTGVYQWYNRINGKVYVGGAYKSFRERERGHRNALRKGHHFNKHLQAAWNQYGESCFVFEILYRCHPNDVAGAEQDWLDAINPTDPDIGYNAYMTVGSPLGTKFSAEVRARMSKANQGKTKGLKHTAEAKAKISEASKKLWQDEEFRELVSLKISITLTGHKLSPESLAKRTEKQRPKIIARNKSEANRAKVSKTLKGHEVSPLTRAKISASLRRRNRS